MEKRAHVVENVDFHRVPLEQNRSHGPKPFDRLRLVPSEGDHLSSASKTTARPQMSP